MPEYSIFQKALDIFMEHPGAMRIAAHPAIQWKITNVKAHVTRSCYYKNCPGRPVYSILFPLWAGKSAGTILALVGAARSIKSAAATWKTTSP